MDLLGKTIGQYQLIEIVHQRENEVYKGFQPAFNRYVAVKVLSPARAADPTFARQFRQDMQQLATLEHPNILPVYDYGQQEGVLYMVTPFVEGGTLEERINQYYSLQQAQQMVQPITEALDFMYRRGAVHGNLKPANILIDPQGQPLLTDFGYTQGIDVGGRENVYLSPEQIQGGAFDQRADVYALGVLLYEMVIGEPPPMGSVPNPRLKRPDLPENVERVILRAMAQDPDQRFQGAGEFGQALTTALPPPASPIAQPVSAAPVPQSAPPAVAPAPPAEPKKSKNWIIYTIITGLLFLCVLAVVCTGLYAFVTGTDDSPIYVPIFLERPTNTPGPAEPPPAIEVTVVVPTREPIVVTPTPVPEEPQPEQPIAPEEPPPEEQPPAEEQPAEEGGG